MPTARFDTLVLGTGLAGTDNADGSITIDSSGSGGPPTGAAGGVLDGSYPNPGLADTAVTPGSYGDATHVATFTVNADGRLTAAGNTTITGSGGASPADTAGWMPLTTVVGGTPDLVWDGDDSLIPTYTTF